MIEPRRREPFSVHTFIEPRYPFNNEISSPAPFILTQLATWPTISYSQPAEDQLGPKIFSEAGLMYILFLVKFLSYIFNEIDIRIYIED